MNPGFFHSLQGVTITLTDLKLGPFDRQRHQLLPALLRPPIKDSCESVTGSAGRQALDLLAQLRLQPRLSNACSSAWAVYILCFNCCQKEEPATLEKADWGPPAHAVTAKPSFPSSDGKLIRAGQVNQPALPRCFPSAPSPPRSSCLFTVTYGQ